jgi:hypothetical protein
MGEVDLPAKPVASARVAIVKRDIVMEVYGVSPINTERVN